MAIIKQSTIILILIISHSLGLDLIGVRKTDTQGTSLNFASVCFLSTFDKSSTNYYLISGILYLPTIFFWCIYETQKDMR